MPTLKIGCYGLNGHQILGLAPELKHATITTISGITPTEFEQIKKAHSYLTDTLRWLPDLEAMLADPQIELVSLCSPRRDEQADHTVQALEAGKHVYAEKPIALTLKDLDHIRDAVERSGEELRAMTGASYAPHFTAMKEVVDCDEIGEVVQVYAQKSYPYHDRRPQDRGVDGGLILQAGIHAVTATRWVTGLEFVTISGFDTMLGNPGDGALQMAAGINFTLSNGGVGVANFNYLNPRALPYWGDDRLRVYGTNGMVECIEGATRLRVTTNDRPTRNLSAPEEKHAAHLQGFIDLLVDGTPMRVSAEDSFLETEVVIAAQRSADQGGRPIAVRRTT